MVPLEGFEVKIMKVCDIIKVLEFNDNIIKKW